MRSVCKEGTDPETRILTALSYFHVVCVTCIAASVANLGICKICPLLAIDTQAHTHTHTFTHTHTYTHTHTHTHTHTYRYTHTYTHTPSHTTNVCTPVSKVCLPSGMGSSLWVGAREGWRVCQKALPFLALHSTCRCVVGCVNGIKPAPFRIFKCALQGFVLGA